MPATNVKSPPAEGASPSEKGATSIRQEVKIMPDLPSQFGHMANAEVRENPLHSVEASGGKSTTEEGGADGFAVSHKGKHSAKPPPKADPSSATSSSKSLKPTKLKDDKKAKINKITGPPKK